MSRMQGSAHREGGHHRVAPVPELLLLLLLSLLLAGLPLANGLCEFPASWTGQWFQTGKPEPVLVNTTVLNNRTCHENKDDMYIVRETSDSKYCYRCMIINKHHENVIQFREEGWCDVLAPLEEMCRSISSDESLTSMFRLDSKPIPCPFTGPPFTFSYSRGYGECANPVSHAESCTDETKLLLKYQACTDVEGTESSTEELQCMAKWKDGRNRYLVGTVKTIGRSIMASYEDTFRCFLYEKSLHQGKVVYELAQSGDATCNGLTSVPEGSRTIKLTKVDKEHNRCKYPSWVTQHHDWHSLDGSKTYHFTTRNATLKVTAQDNNDDVFHEEKIVCHNLEKLYPNDNMQGHTVKLVAHITSGCDSGYVCMMFHKRDGHIIELQQSDQKAIMPEEACTFSDPSTMPYTTLITSALHQRRCPYPGRYTIVYMLSEMASSTSRRQRRSMKPPPRTAERRTWPDDREEDDCRSVEIGCSSANQNEMTIDSTCDIENDAYLCHGSWEENGTWYTIASPRSSKLTAGPVRAYCFSMRMTDVPVKAPRRGGGSGDHHEQELQLSSHLLTCQRDTAVQWTYRLASQGVCEDLTKAASSTASSSSLSRVSLVLSAGAAVLCTLLSR